MIGAAGSRDQIMGGDSQSGTVYSMTGFGAGRVEAVLGDQCQLTVIAEIKTVNHKHLQAKIRLPQEYSSLEPVIHKQVRQALARGAVQMFVEVARVGGDAGVQIDAGMARRYLEMQAGLASELKGIELAPIASMVDLIHLPGVIVQSTGPAGGVLDPAGTEASAVLEAVAAALEQLKEMRSVEGAAMRRDLEKNAQEIARLVAEIAARSPGIVAQHRKRLVERVAELSTQPSTTEADIAREIALLSDRLDVSEEVTRLESHLEQLGSLVRGGGAIGRKLDFLAQEFFREANTIGSKCSDANVAHLVVDLKTHVERLREQVQNVE